MTVGWTEAIAISPSLFLKKRGDNNMANLPSFISFLNQIMLWYSKEISQCDGTQNND